MVYLLDVNALVALGSSVHEFHHRVAVWVRSLASKGIPKLATCPITELGFVRVMAQTPQYGSTVAHARALLLSLKSANNLELTFISDDLDASQLPAWVKFPNQTTDGHLLQLARSKGAVLATLDSQIPGAFLIPFQRTGRS
jgi:predicted nucleic acid-binding protein